MRVFVFDLMPYGEDLDHLKEGKELPWPLPKQHFKPEVAVRTYEEHLEAWEELDRLGYDGVGFNEHHTSPYGLDELAEPHGRLGGLAAHQAPQAADLRQPPAAARPAAPGRGAGRCSTACRTAASISGFARGIPREYDVYGVPLDGVARPLRGGVARSSAAPGPRRSSPSRASFWSYEDVAIWPRPVQQPHPPVWVPVTSSKETIEWAARNNIPITPGAGARGPARGHHPLLRPLPDRARPSAHARPPDHPGQRLHRRQQGAGGQGSGAVHPVLQPHAVQPRQRHRGDRQRDTGYLSSDSFDYVRPENLGAVAGAREDYRDMTMEDIERDASACPGARRTR